MKPPRRLKPLTAGELQRMPRARLLAYRKVALSLENSLEESDYHDTEARALDPRYIWFKSDPRWQPLYDSILNALATVQGRSTDDG